MGTSTVASVGSPVTTSTDTSSVQLALESELGSYLPLAGGTMAGNIAMNSNKVTGLAAATTNGDAIRYEQVNGIYLKLDGTTNPSANLPMNSKKLTGLAAGTTNGDALRYEQVIGVFLALDGSTNPSANLPMNSHKLTGLSAGSGAGDSVRYEQVIGVFLALDGSTNPSANLPMNSHKLTGLSAGSGAGDSVRYEQVLLLAGGTMAGNIAMGSNLVTGLPAASASGHAMRVDEVGFKFGSVVSTATTGTSIPNTDRWQFPVGTFVLQTADGLLTRSKVLKAGYLNNLRCVTGSANAQTITVTVYNGGSATALTVSNPNTASTETIDNTHSVAVAAGDEISVYTKAGGASATMTSIEFWWTPI